MGELAVRLLAQHGEPATQLVQQAAAENPARPVVAVQDHAEAAAADPLGVDGFEHGQQVGGDGVVATQARAEPVVRRLRGLLAPGYWRSRLSHWRAVSFEDFAAAARRESRAPAAENSLMPL